MREAAGGAVPLIGCTTAGELAGTVAGSGHVVVIALGGIAVRTARGLLADGSRAAGAAAAAGIAAIEAPNRAVLLLAEALTGERSEIVRGAFSVAGALVPLIGGGAGDDLAMRQTHQFFDDDVLTGAVVGAAIGSDGPIGIGIGHGWQRVGEPMVVTESSGERIRRFDDQPAAEQFLRRVGVDAARADDPEVWAHAALMHPVGFPRPAGDEVRAIMGVDYEDRSLFCPDVPQGTMVWAMKGDAGTVMDGTRTACERALEMLGDAPPVGLLAFDCAARRAILGEDGIRAEAAAIAELAPGVPVGGFYTYGEIARVSGSRGVHNATLAVLALG